MIYPNSFWTHVSPQDKDKVLQGIVTLFFEDQIRIEEESGKLLFSKTGINKIKKVFIEVLELADRAAIEGEKYLGNIEAKAKAEKNLTPEERAKKAGLTVVKAKVPNGKLIIGGE